MRQRRPRSIPISVPISVPIPIPESKHGRRRRRTRRIRRRWRSRPGTGPRNERRRGRSIRRSRIRSRRRHMKRRRHRRHAFVPSTIPIPNSRRRPPHVPRALHPPNLPLPKISRILIPSPSPSPLSSCSWTALWPLRLRIQSPRPGRMHTIARALPRFLVVRSIRRRSRPGYRSRRCVSWS